VLAIAILIVLVIADHPFPGLLNTGTLTVIAIAITTIIQDARGLISAYHLSLAHHITLVMLPAILSMAAKAARLRVTPSPPAPAHVSPPLPRSTIATAALSLSLILAMIGMAASNHDRCSFDGHYLMGPQYLSPVVWVGLVLYGLSWMALLVLSLNKRFQNATNWRATLADGNRRSQILNH
jgi:hypothetical protein